MKFNQEIGKRFANVAIGVTQNTGTGVELMQGRFNGNLRNKPRDPREVHLERQNKLLRDYIEKQKRG